MLRSFRVANHRSLRDEQELLLMPSHRGQAPVVPVAAVFGANASGKSNLVDALRWMSVAVLSSCRSWEAESGVPRSPYRLDPSFVGKTSEFVADLIIDGVQYGYGFGVTGEAVVEEWLHSYPHGRERVIFERHGASVDFGSTVPERRSRAQVLSGLLRDNALLLSTAMQAKHEEVLPVYRWFRDSLRVPDSRRSWARTPGVFANRLLVAVQRHPEFVSLMKAADLGIADIQIAGRTVVFLHGEGQAVLTLEDQSDGTLALTDLLLAALAALKGGGFLVIDEIDASLHPRLTARLIELFRSPAANARGAQLLFTTHDVTLFGTSFGAEFLRRDEIWFVEKRDGASRLYPLSDFHPRDGENREHRYLAGSYGAVPVVFEDSLVEAVGADRIETLTEGSR